MATLLEFKQALVNSPFYSKIFEKYHVMLLFVGGSWLYGLEDERSDYDLVAICAEHGIRDPEPDFCFMWKGVKVHWSYHSPEFYTEPSVESWCLRNVGLSAFRWVRDEVIICRNPEYEKEVKALLDAKEEIADNAARILYTQLKPYVEEVLATNTIDEEHRSKLLCHLLRTYYELKRIPLDIEFLKTIKRIRWRPVPEEYITKSVALLRELKQLMEQ